MKVKSALPSTKSSFKKYSGRSALLAFGYLLTGCAVGPDYQRPDVAASQAFKAAADIDIPGWKRAEPNSATRDERWWEIYGDNTLNELIAKLDAANQNIHAAEARFRQSRALAQLARADFFPTLSAAASVSHSGGSGARNNSSSVASSGSGAAANRRSATLDASWELDVWGRVRRSAEAGEAYSAASSADLAAVSLSTRAELAVNYFQLRVLDAQKKLIDRTLDGYQKALQLTRNRNTIGVASRADVVQAESQLSATQAQSYAVILQRAQLEHAIAILIGSAPADFSLPVLDGDLQKQLLEKSLPDIPAVLPSQLLERRPDIAAAEYRVRAANAGIGVAQSAYFPTIGLSASGGYESTRATDWLTLTNRFWSLGPTLATTLFDGGKRSAAKNKAIAVYDETVANYRQGVLTGFQEVEDNLSALQFLALESDSQNAAVRSANESVQLLTNQYRVGKVAYLNVISVQTIAYTNERTALQIIGQRYAASIGLIKAVGGGFHTTQ